MKSTLSLAVAASGVQQAAAALGSIGLGLGVSFDFDVGFSSAKSFNCPSNIVNQCTPQQEQGWDFSDLATGAFEIYAGFDFSGGWSCEDNSRKRGVIQGRNFGPGKVISGTCDQGSNAGLDIAVGAKAGVDAFSISSFDLSTEFDARLEFHYDMADGSVCKQTADCQQGGSTIVNNQCGGAKNVRIIYPNQIKTSLNLNKKCKVSCHKIKWHCGKPETTPSTSLISIPGTTTRTTQATSSLPGTTSTPSGQGSTSTQSGQQTTSTITVPGTETTTVNTELTQQSTSSAYGTTSTKPDQGTTSSTNTTPGTTSQPGQGTTTSTQSGQDTTSQSGQDTTSTQPGQQTTSTTTAPATGTTTANTKPDQQTPSAPGTTSQSGQQTTSATTIGTQTSTFITTYDMTSTVFATSTKTIISCGPTVTECPGKTGSHIVTVTIPVSTTICPVTEIRTRTQVGSTTAVLPSNSKTESNVKPTDEKPNPTSEKPNPTGQAPKPNQPPPCPSVVPRCLNTFLELKSKCKDNTDAGCYCPNKEFVDTIFNCIYAHGENDNIISEAIAFFQGICGPYIPQNPCIVTGARPITEIITVTGTPRITSVPYTTIVYATTNVGQSTTQTVSLVATIPNIAMPTATGAQPSQPVATPPAASQPNTSPSGPAGQPGIPPAITGTGGLKPSVPTSSIPVTAGAGRAGAGIIIAAVAFMVAL